MEDDKHILDLLSGQKQFCQRGGGGASRDGGREVLLNPNCLRGKITFVNVSMFFFDIHKVCLTHSGGGVASSHSSSDCLLITVMELPEESLNVDSLRMLNVVGLYRPPSLYSLPWNLDKLKCHSRSFPRCLLGVLCLVSTLKISTTSTHSSLASSLLSLCMCVCTGIFQLPASGDLSVDDWSVVGGRGPG